MTQGYVYFLRLKVFQDKWACPYKIGKSKDIPRRASQIGIVMPYPIEIIHTIETPNMHRLEKYMHGSLSEFHAQGEWFNLSRECVEWLCSHWTTDHHAKLCADLST